jgi:predicted membrane protein
MDRTRALLGSLLVLAGVVFLLDAADVIPARDILSGWWPVALIALGLFVMFGSPGSLTGGGILAAIGAVLLLATLDIIEISLWQLIIPLILIGAGLSLVIRGISPGGKADRSNRVNLMGVLSEQRIRSESGRFQRASLTSILGDVNLDLRNSTLDVSGAEVDAFCLLGDINIIVPRGWRVHVQGMPILGDFEDKTDHEQHLPHNAPELTITGVSILADVQIKHA